MPTSLTDLIARVRAEIGDPSQPFRTTALGDGRTQWYDLPKQEIQAIAEAAIISNAAFTVLADCSAATAGSSTTAYTTGALVTYNGGYFQCTTGNTGRAADQHVILDEHLGIAYIINDQLGQIQLGKPVPNNATLIMAGVVWSMFSDVELTTYITDALNQHCYNRESSSSGTAMPGASSTTARRPVAVLKPPGIEVPLVVMLATINTFWTLANDTASDFNMATAEGTSIDRSASTARSCRRSRADRAVPAAVRPAQRRHLPGRDDASSAAPATPPAAWCPVHAAGDTTTTSGRAVSCRRVDRRYQDNSGIPTPYWAGHTGRDMLTLV